MAPIKGCSHNGRVSADVTVESAEEHIKIAGEKVWLKLL